MDYELILEVEKKLLISEMKKHKKDLPFFSMEILEMMNEQRIVKELRREENLQISSFSWQKHSRYYYNEKKSLIFKIGNHERLYKF